MYSVGTPAMLYAAYACGSKREEVRDMYQPLSLVIAMVCALSDLVCLV